MKAIRCFAVFFAFVTAGGCARGPSMDARPDTRPPIIDRIDPTSGPAGEDYPIELTIHGSGFAEADNVVRIGSVTISNRPSTNAGTLITIAVPKMIDSRGEVPPMVLQPGEYPITVTTVHGTSEPVMFRLTRDFEENSNR